VSSFAVNVLEQRRQLLTEGVVIMRAAQAAGIPKLDELQTAFGTLALIERRGLGVVFRGHPPFALAILLGVGLVEILLGALFAQVVFFEPVFNKDFSDVQGGLFGALVALHRRVPLSRIAPFREGTKLILTGEDMVSIGLPACRSQPPTREIH